MDSLKNVFMEEFGKKIIAKIVEYVEGKYSKSINQKRWSEAVKTACICTEGVDIEYGEFFRRYSSINRYFIKLCNNTYGDDVYKDFIVASVVETNNRSSKMIAFSIAILDNWFENSGKNADDYKKKLDLNEVADVISENKKIYSCYFQSYDNHTGPNKIRVYYPKQGKDYLEWDKDDSVIVHVNLSKGVEYGFCRVGLDYACLDDSNEKFIKYAYVNGEKELLRFNNTDELSEENELVWVR